MELALYIHLPYCITKCPYCDFNSHGVGDTVPEDSYAQALVGELTSYACLLQDHTIKTVFFGGGTPSLFTARSIGMILSEAKSITSFAKDAEITMEVNPRTADIAKFNGFADAGVNRLSVGIQSFSDRKLKFLGRNATPSDNIECIEQVLASDIKNLNLDLMYGTTDETNSEWQNDLKSATGYAPNHISAYCLTIESGTEFKKKQDRGELVLPSEYRLADMIDFTTDFLANNGYKQYEISNYAMAGYECLHNCFYWRGENYLGIGAGAHSHIKSSGNGDWGKRWSNIKYPARYMSAVENNTVPVDKSETLTRLQAYEDDLMMGLRLLDGLDMNKIRKTYNTRINLHTEDYLFSEDLISHENNKISLTKKGVLVSDYIISALLERTVFETV